MGSTGIVLVVMAAIATMMGVILLRAQLSTRQSPEQYRLHEQWKVQNMGYEQRLRQLRQRIVALLLLVLLLPPVSIAAFLRFDETSTYNFSTRGVEGNAFLFLGAIIGFIGTFVAFRFLLSSQKKLKALRSIFAPKK